MEDRTSIGSAGGFKPGGRSSVNSDHGPRTSVQGRSSTGSNSIFSATQQPKGFGDADPFSGSNLHAKQQYVDDHMPDGFNIEDMEELGTVMRKFFSEDLPTGTVNALKGVASALTPGFIRRYKNTKIHAKEVEDRDE